MRVRSGANSGASSASAEVMPVRRGALRVLKRLQIHLQAGHLEQRQAVLPVSEEIARSALRQVRFCNFEAVVRGAEGFQPRLRLGIAVRREEYAVGLRIPGARRGPAADGAARGRSGRRFQ